MKLLQWRKSLNLTLAKAAEHCRISNARTYQRYERGERKPDVETTQRIISLAKGVTRDDIDETVLEYRRAVTAEQPRPDVFGRRGKREQQQTEERV